MTVIPETIDSGVTLSETKLSERIVSKTRSAETTLFDMRIRDKTLRSKASEKINNSQSGRKSPQWPLWHARAAMARTCLIGK